MTLAALGDPLKMCESRRGEAQYHVVMLLGKQQDSSYVGFVMVEGVELRRGHVERPFLWEAVI